MADVHENSEESSGMHPNQSMSTDSEESFLVKQINKSQLFNNSSSSGSSKQRRSFFRESYIDEDGALKSFSVYQDVINETSDESRDVSLSGLSTFNIENVVGAEPRNSHLQNILIDVDANSRHRQGSQEKTTPISKSDSSKDQQSRQPHKRLSDSSFRISTYENLPDPRGGKSNNESSHTHSHSSGASFHTVGGGNNSDRRPPSSTYSRVSSRDLPLRLASPVPEVSLPALDLRLQGDDHLVHRVPTPDYRAPSPPAVDSEGNPTIIHNELTLDALSQLAPKEHTPTSTVGSLRSARSQTKDTILNFEGTRKKQRGIPVVFVQSQFNTSNAQLHDSGYEQGRRNVKLESAASIGVTPSIRFPSSVDLEDDASIKDTRTTKMLTGQAIVMKNVALKEFKLKPAAEKNKPESQVAPYDKQAPNSGGEHPSDALLEKLLDARENYRAQRNPHNTRTWALIVYFLSFAVPPMFFFLGLGSLDQYIGTVGVGLKRISLLTGALVLVVSMAMIGVGFGVGLARE